MGVFVIAAGTAEVDIRWACEEHLQDLAVIVHGEGHDPQERIFEVSRTCRAQGPSGAQCGGAGDYLVIYGTGESVVTVCTRHMEEWRPGDGGG